MNLSAIKTLTENGKRCHIVTGLDAQWFFNGLAWYLIEGLTIDKTETVVCLFNLTPKQLDKAKIILCHSDNPLLTPDRTTGDELLDEIGSIWFAGTLYAVLHSTSGLLAFDLTLAKPVRADYRTYYARWPDDPNEPPLIAIFDNLDACRAIVTPAGPEITRPLQAMAKLMCAPWLDTAAPEEPEEESDP